MSSPFMLENKLPFLHLPLSLPLQLPERFLVELQYRALPQGGHPGPWEGMRIEGQGLEVEVQGLEPGTKYVFR